MTTTPITFFVPGEPKGQPRPRAFAMKLAGGKYSARVFDSGTAEGWKSQIASVAVQHRPKIPAADHVSVALTFNFKRPGSHFKGKTLTLRENRPYWHTAKPDGDNLAKAVLDTLTQLGGFWRDDSQVATLHVNKVYVTHPETLTGCWITITYGI